MSTFRDTVIEAFKAGADLSSSQYTAVKLDSTVEQVVAAGAGEEAYGILQNAPASGKAASVGVEGGSYAIAGAAVTIGTKVKVGTSGKLIPVTADNDFYIGRAVTAASADGDRFSISIEKGFQGGTP